MNKKEEEYLRIFLLELIKINRDYKDIRLDEVIEALKKLYFGDPITPKKVKIEIKHFNVE